MEEIWRYSEKVLRRNDNDEKIDSIIHERAAGMRTCGMRQQERERQYAVDAGSDRSGHIRGSRNIRGCGFFEESETAQAQTPIPGKTLVVYDSASGNTEQVAGDIAAATGGDLFKLMAAFISMRCKYSAR